MTMFSIKLDRDNVFCVYYHDYAQCSSISSQNTLPRGRHEQTTGPTFHKMLKNIKIIEYHYHIWNHHGKCIRISTNMLGIGFLIVKQAFNLKILTTEKRILHGKSIAVVKVLFLSLTFTYCHRTAFLLRNTYVTIHATRVLDKSWLLLQLFPTSTKTLISRDIFIFNYVKRATCRRSKSKRQNWLENIQKKAHKLIKAGHIKIDI